MIENVGDYIQIYTNGNPMPFDLAGSDGSPRHGGGLGVGQICKRGFAANTATDGNVNTFANSIWCKMVYSYQNVNKDFYLCIGFFIRGELLQSRAKDRLTDR